MGCIESKAVQEQAEEVEMIKQPAASAVPEEILGFNVARLASKTHCEQLNLWSTLCHGIPNTE